MKTVQFFSKNQSISLKKKTSFLKKYKIYNFFHPKSRCITERGSRTTHLKKTQKKKLPISIHKESERVTIRFFVQQWSTVKSRIHKR
jgi:hypothetical protein